MPLSFSEGKQSSLNNRSFPKYMKHVRHLNCEICAMVFFDLQECKNKIQSTAHPCELSPCSTTVPGFRAWASRSHLASAFALVPREEAQSNPFEHEKAYGAETSHPSRGPARVLTVSSQHQTREAIVDHPTPVRMPDDCNPVCDPR